MSANYYGQLPANVRYAKISPSAKVLYSEFSALTHREGYAFASNSYFAKLYEVSPTTVSAWINELKNAGFIRVEIDAAAGNDRKIWIIEGLDGKEKTYTAKAEEGSSGKAEHNNTRENIKKEKNKEDVPGIIHSRPPSSPKKEKTDQMKVDGAMRLVHAERILAEYPVSHNTSKKKAILAILQCLKTQDHETLMVLTKLWARMKRDGGDDPKFVTSAQVWFGESRFENLIEPPKNPASGNKRGVPSMDDYLAHYAEQDRLNGEA